MAEHVGGPPKKLYVGTIHLLKGVVGDGLHTGLIFLDHRPLLDKIDIVEAEVLYAQLVHYLEAGVHLVLRPLKRVGGLVPFIVPRLAAELVSARLTEGVPPGHRELEPVLHLLSENDSPGIIIMECQRISAFRTLERNLADLWEILFCHS